MRILEDLGIGLPVYAVGYRREYDDVLGDWAALREIDDHGALLVRPDRHIAWRSHTRPDDPQDALRTTVRHALRLDDRNDSTHRLVPATVDAAVGT